MSEFKKYAEQLANGGVILYPTDTIWGLGCDATNENACNKIKAIKNRTDHHSFIVLVDSVLMLERYVPDFNPVCYDLIDNTDTPLTIIYPTSKNLAPSVVGKDGSVGIRVTKDQNCIQLIRQLKKPIVSTSANISGKPFPQTFEEIEDSIKSQVDAIIQTENTTILKKPSKIIKIDLDGTFKILRS